MHLLNKLKQNFDIVSSPTPVFDPNAPWKLFLNRRAAYQGREMASAFAFIADELRSHIGARALTDTLYHCRSEVGLAIARRLATPRATASARLAAARVMVDGQAMDTPLASALLSIGECARHDVIVPQNARTLVVAVAIDNPSDIATHFPCVELRVQVQTRREASLKSSPVCVFSSLLRIESGERAWLPFRGVDLLGELRSELPQGEELHALRFLFTRK
ncbi:MAG: hypothetical protein L6Q71_02555 [Planctomycetes bacterium]|nr:hypothetical protein [Planctomycetota bacterium]NUQ34404.1 hypothetical protein [Planctomycetaceae bacterium]